MIPSIARLLSLGCVGSGVTGAGQFWGVVKIFFYLSRRVRTHKRLHPFRAEDTALPPVESGITLNFVRRRCQVKGFGVGKDNLAGYGAVQPD
jgi:hypothetical protein